MAENRLNAMFGDSGTVFSGNPISPVPTFNIAESMGISGGSAILVNSLAQQIIPQLLGNKNVNLGQFMPQTNLFDQFKQRSIFDMQQQAVRQGAALDKKTYEKTFRTLANLTGTPFGAREQAGADVMSGDLAAIMPILTQMAPDLVDRMHGSRGSAAVMAMRMASGSRYMTDPLSGSLGMSKDSVNAMHQNVHEDLFGEKADILKMRGVTAGQAGAMFDEMSRRGIMGSGQRSLKEIMGVGNKLTPEEFAKSPDIEKKIQQFESGRISEKIKGMAGAISAVKDIFGENGKTDAPMSELFNALQKMTQNNIANMKPAEAERMVRNASNVAKMTGMTLEGMMSNIAGAGQVTDKFGINRAFAPGIASSSALYAQAHTSVLGGTTGFNLMGKEEVLGMRRQIEAAAIASPQANAMAAIIRGSEMGVLDKSPEVSQYIKDVKAGKAQFKSRSELQAMAVKAGMSASMFNQLSEQTVANQAVIHGNNISANLDEGQRNDVKTVTSGHFAGNLDQKLGKKTNDVSEYIANRLTNMTQEETQKFSERNYSFLAEGLKDRHGVEFENIKSELAVAVGQLDETAALHNFKNSINMLSLVNKRTASQHKQNQGQADADTDLATAMSKLNRSGPMQRIADLFIGGMGNKTIAEVTADILGSTSSDRFKSVGIDIEKELINKDALAKRIPVSDALTVENFKNRPDNSDRKKILEAYGVTNEEVQFKSQEEIQAILSMARKKLQKEAIDNLPTLFLNQGIPIDPTGIPKNVFDNVEKAASYGATTTNAGSLAISLGENISGDTDTLKKFTKKKADSLISGLKTSGEALSSLEVSKSTKEGALASLGRKEDQELRSRVATTVNTGERIDLDLKKILDANKLTNVDELRRGIGATPGQLTELLDQRNDLNIARGKSTDKTLSEEERKKARDKIKTIEQSISNFAQENNFNANSVLNTGILLDGMNPWKSTLNPVDQNNSRDLLVEKEKNSRLLATQVVEAKKLGLSADVLDGSVPNIRKQLASYISSLTKDSGEITSSGINIMSEKDVAEYAKSIETDKNRRLNPGDELEGLLKGPLGLKIPLPEGLKEQLGKMGAAGKRQFAGDLGILDMAKSSNVSFDAIGQFFSGSSTSGIPEELKTKLLGLSEPVIDAIKTGKFEGLSESLDTDAKEKIEKQKKEGWSYVRLESGTQLNGHLDFTTGQYQLNVDPATKT